jgi:hypothetical protein
LQRTIEQNYPSSVEEKLKKFISRKPYRDLFIDGAFGPMTVDSFKVALSQRPPAKDVTESRILRILTLLHGGLWIDKMRKYPEREELRGIFDRV